MPKAVRMPKNLEEVPIHDPDSGDRNQHRHFGWFAGGFIAAALLFGSFLVYQDYFGSAVAGHDDARTIIVGK